MTLTFGTPTWTTGGFATQAALDDLGIEAVGADMLRRFIPGVISTTSNAGYYSFFSYLHARWEDHGEGIRRIEFKPYYRRQEAAFATACALHAHRDNLTGAGGVDAASKAAKGSEVDVDRLADRYLKSAYGIYSNYYRGVIYDVRLTRIGEGNLVDRVTERGRRVAEAFARAFEATEYFRHYHDADVVPVEVLRELGEAVCLCTVPGRSDHGALLDTFFGLEEEEEPDWERRRRTRLASLGLFLEFAEQRPDDVPGTVGTWRRCLLAEQFPDGTPWQTRFPEIRASWRAYQLREVLSLALDVAWVAYLTKLGELEPIDQTSVIEALLAEVPWGDLGVGADTPWGQAADALAAQVPDPVSLIEEGERLERPNPRELGEVLGRVLRLLAGVVREAQVELAGFTELLEDGGESRWSVRHVVGWLGQRSDLPVRELLRWLLGSLVRRHFEVATAKLRPTERRDPFCIGEDDGLQWVIRPDEPMWTDGRFRVVHHLLWTLGVLDGPDGDGRLTDVGRRMKRRTEAVGA